MRKTLRIWRDKWHRRRLAWGCALRGHRLRERYTLVHRDSGDVYLWWRGCHTCGVGHVVLEPKFLPHVVATHTFASNPARPS